MGSGVRLIARLVARHPVSFALAVLGAAMFAAAIVGSSIVVGRATDSLIVPVLDGGLDPGGRLGPVLLGVVAVAMVKAVGITLRKAAAGYLQFRSQADIRLSLIRRILELDMGWYRRQSIGDLIAVTDADTHQAAFILAPVPYGVGSSLLLIGTVGMITWIDPLLALVVLIGLVAVVALDVSGSWRTFGAFAGVQELRGEVARLAHESFDGALTVAALGREDEETARFRLVSERLRHRLASVGSVFSTYRVLVEGLLSTLTVVVLVVGALQVRSGDLSAGNVVTVAYLLSLLFLPIRILGFVLWDMSHSNAAWERIEQVLEAKETVRYGTVERRSRPTGAEVDGISVEFGYTAEAPVLTDLHLAIPPGQIVAVVGPTGSGKSTLAILLARLWDPTEGQITVDGADLRDLSREALANEVAFVAQENFLFDDTVRGNIAFGGEFSDEDVHAAAEIAGVDFVAALPDGWDTRLGERGATLSGGQRQRIALARALVRRPRLLIMDDATSAVDPSVEARILERLRQAEMPSTVVVVAYRRSSIMLADEVVFVDDGRIVAQGPHRRLLTEVPAYAEILEAYEREAEQRRNVANGDDE